MTTMTENEIVTYTSEDLREVVVAVARNGAAMAKALGQLNVAMFDCFTDYSEEDARADFDRARMVWENALTELKGMADTDNSVRCGWPGGQQLNAGNWHYLLSVSGHPVAVVKAANKRAVNKTERENLKSIPKG